MTMLALRNSNQTPVESLLDSFFDNNFWINRNVDSYGSEPASYNYDEEAKEHVIAVQAPGFKKSDIQIEVDHQGISLNGELHDENIKRRIGQKKFHYVMKKYGIDSKTVNATLEDGILWVRFKTEKEKSTKKIEIKGS